MGCSRARHALGMVDPREGGLIATVKVAIDAILGLRHALMVGQHVDVDAVAIARPQEVADILAGGRARGEGKLRRVG